MGFQPYKKKTSIYWVVPLPNPVRVTARISTFWVGHTELKLHLLWMWRGTWLADLQTQKQKKTKKNMCLLTQVISGRSKPIHFFLRSKKNGGRNRFNPTRRPDLQTIAFVLKDVFVGKVVALHSLKLTANVLENRRKRPKRKGSSSNHPFSGANC